MPGGRVEIHRDTDYLATGVHDGSDSASVLSDIGADFISNGINANVGQAVLNTTQDTDGVVTASTEDTLTVSGVTWDEDDTYEVYKTAAKNTKISSIWVDKSRGWRSDRETLDRGWRSSDVDVDRDDPHAWGGRPEKPRY